MEGVDEEGVGGRGAEAEEADEGADAGGGEGAAETG